ncbi:hypothetical protein GCM10025881_36220 [Pseudolysinimonas kribbensis]|uniref:Cytosine permease n=1 Tax=Pseudolysinimonas kribbensis TaxID=433641 RepID=A0ABQ6KBN9_9MICO|nr:cytosine permease [Pseudolysinimonas kribbensis]GMA96798.1 hypothetical protein GCM10025881_36220 [Pseudolysinimonas kribbensis]
MTAESESEAAHAPVVEPALGTSPESPPSSEPDRDPLSAAPPPLYTPPPLVEPPAPPASPEPVARLLPPPTDLPDIAFRAELPPPPGYAEDGTPSPAEPPESGSADAAAPVALDPDPAPAPAPETLLPEAAEPAAASPGWDHLLAMVPEPTTPAAVAPEPLTPTPAWAPAAEPTTTEAPTPRAPAAGDVDDDDDVIDPADRVGPSPVIPLPVEGVAMAAGSPPAPSPPPTAAPTTAGVAAGATEEREPRLPRALAVETAGIEPTPREQRAGRAARLFWLWFAANASLVSVALGAVMLGTGMSLRQAIVATVVGIALSFIPLGFTTLAGKRSSQPTLVVSRSAFGTDGNLLPTILAILVRVFWGGVLLWMLGDALGRTLVPADADAGLGATRWALIGAAVGLLLTALVAAIGYGLLARVQLILSILTGLLIVGAAAVTLPKVHLDVALTRQDGPWLLIIGGAVLVFAFVGLVWAFSGSDLARYQRASASGASSMLWATFGATIPPFLLIVWGALLAASNPALATAFAAHPLSSIAGLLPSWYAAPLFVAAAVGLLSGSVLTLYSGGFALQNLTPQVPRVVGVVVAALLAFATAAGLVLLGADTRTVVHDLAVTLAVPVAGWAGIFAAEIMIRNRGFHTPSLLASGGIYPRVRWVNFIGLIVIAVVGYGFVSGGATWLGWEGFGWRLLGVGASEPLAGVDLGVLLALVLGILLPLVSAVPTIRRQEAAMDDGVAIART